ncbi:MAG: nitrogenase iron-molybdenum cofactor biosynthesis protein NifN [Thermostichus sp. HHBFW_bins_43]
MAQIIQDRKPLSVNPLKLSAPLGAALAFLGIKGCLPLFHGSQGCTAFAKVVLVRHFREAIPMATTAMSEVDTILGGEENIETAILTLVEKAQPELIGLLTTGLTETRGDDMPRILQELRRRQPQLDGLPIVLASTPDFKGSLQEGFATAVNSLVQTLPEEGPVDPAQVTVLCGSALTPADGQEIKEMVQAFGLDPILLPDLSGSLDGHLGEGFAATPTGGTSLAQIRRMGRSALTLAIGDSMLSAAHILNNRFGTPFQLFPHLTGLKAVDAFLAQLADYSKRPVPARYRQQRRQVQDALLDSHFYFGGKRIALALEADLLWGCVDWLLDMGCVIQAAICPTATPSLGDLPLKTVYVGDLGDLESLAQGADLLVGNSHVARIGKRLGIPVHRLGIPIFDRLGANHLCQVGYRGTLAQLFSVGNLLMEQEEAHP